MQKKKQGQQDDVAIFDMNDKSHTANKNKANSKKDLDQLAEVDRSQLNGTDSS